MKITITKEEAIKCVEFCFSNDFDYDLEIEIVDDTEDTSCTDCECPDEEFIPTDTRSDTDNTTVSDITDAYLDGKITSKEYNVLMSQVTDRFHRLRESE